ncbi:MAG: hypothetical protein M3Z33_01800 [Actinomycetota bacterium]|nr:hypothetical protein [Actinomycetota bacterium]
MIEAEHEQARQGSGEDFTDAVTFAFGDGEAELYGMTRLGIAPRADTMSALAVVFSGREPVAVRARGDLAVDGAGWEDVEGAGLHIRVDEPLRHWSAAFAHDDAEFELSFTALAPALEFGPDSAVARAGGMESYEHLCHVEGWVTVAGQVTQLHCLGQRGHAWGNPDWNALERATSVSGWIGEDRAFVLQAALPHNAPGHDAESVSLVSIEPGENGLEVLPAVDPRLSTTYDAAGHHRRAGLEYWLDEEGYARRAAGEVVCGTTLELGRLRMDSAFFAWSLEGERGVGRYEVLRRA